PTRALGAQAEIDAPAEAVVGDVLERLREALRDAREVLVQRLLHGRAVLHHLAVVRLVERDEIDVAPGLELAPPELPHAEHRESAFRAARRSGRSEAR